MAHEISKTISITEIELPTWPERCKDEVEAILKRYPEGQERSAILPLLHLSMREREGHYVAVSDMAAIGEICGVATAYVDSVCSFYAMYHRHAIGKYLITICGNMCCHLLGGGKQLVEHIETAYGLKNGETTADGLLTLEVTGECLSACDLAPVMHVNTEYAVKMTPSKFDALVEALRAGLGPEAFLEKLPLMNGASQDAWTGYEAAAAAPEPEAPAPVTVDVPPADEVKPEAPSEGN